MLYIQVKYTTQPGNETKTCKFWQVSQLKPVRKLTRGQHWLSEAVLRSVQAFDLFTLTLALQRHAFPGELLIDVYLMSTKK